MHDVYLLSQHFDGVAVSMLISSFPFKLHEIFWNCVQTYHVVLFDTISKHIVMLVIWGLN